MNLGNPATFVVGSHSEFNNMDETKAHAGWDVTRRILVLRYAHALRRGEVYSLRTRADQVANANA